MNISNILLVFSGRYARLWADRRRFHRHADGVPRRADDPGLAPRHSRALRGEKSEKRETGL